MERTSISRKLVVVAGCVALVCVADVGVSLADMPIAVTMPVGGDMVSGKDFFLDAAAGDKKEVVGKP